VLLETNRQGSKEWLTSLVLTWLRLRYFAFLHPYPMQACLNLIVETGVRSLFWFIHKIIQSFLIMPVPMLATVYKSSGLGETCWSRLWFTAHVVQQKPSATCWVGLVG
jgi:surface polysaccharide O-acyltransferase-like enzyme